MDAAGGRRETTPDATGEHAMVDPTRTFNPAVLGSIPRGPTKGLVVFTWIHDAPQPINF